LNIASKSKKRKPVILLFGPTASGKSRIILEVLGQGFEVINADSQQVYKYLDIGTAKPAKEEMVHIPHHLVDICDPKEQFNAGKFVSKANEIIPRIFSRNKIPLVSGGTGFYIKNFIYGLPPAPPSDPEVRKYIRKKVKARGLETLYKDLCIVDPVYAQKIQENDSLRIIRALEVYEISGKPLSSFQLPEKEREDIVMYKLCLAPGREELYKRIENRVEKMFACGLVDEVRSLIQRGYSTYDPGMKSIGYHEFFLMQLGCFLFQDIKDLIKRNTRHYAKRQITFFKSFDNVSWFHPDDCEGIQKGIKEFLAINYPAKMYGVS
jgi:tRNA dimethylallyltransferase